jgi:4'-phosphopantetheinyl transferase
MTTVYHLQFDDEAIAHTIDRLLPCLPGWVAKKAGKMPSRQKACAYVAGKSLLQMALHDYRISNSLDTLQYTTHGRPYLNAPIDFNLSHAGNTVLCAISSHARIGVDIEYIRHTRNIIGLQYWTGNGIQPAGSEDAKTGFYTNWTMTEAALKADGRGLAVPRTQIQLAHSQVMIEKSIYHCMPLPAEPGYCAHLASQTKIDLPLIIKINPGELYC